ncbi:MAG: SpaH/EbpB family LPXTG-anchored major pilin, partial [Clostridiales Family XIII bacterium]|nr:SpaH/EbpB family LPXTG-anchored major pilin [Clostridiales Family XIII bacterium]
KNTKLSGAKFRIATSVDNAKEGIFLQKDEYGEIYQGYGPDDDEMWEETTNSDGVAKFEGIADGLKDSDGEDVSGNTYYLVEIKAPDGYNLLSEPVAVTFVSGAQKANKNNNYSMKAEIMNNTGFELPKTGGMGTVVFTVGGAVLMGLAVLIFVICRKKDKEENAEA